MPAAVGVEPDGPDHRVVQVGSDTPQMSTLCLELLDAHPRATAERFRKAAGAL
ncbi:hypothetical protein [Nocardia sp. NPDC057440]|uniref:hypothetical protein n=1 Tax=Nocardia sp. NPDC057440 TaxID=3346134 RepID=UPI00366DD411